MHTLILLFVLLGNIFFPFFEGEENFSRTSHVSFVEADMVCGRKMKMMRMYVFIDLMYV